MKHLSFAKDIIILIVGVVAFVLLIAEGETWRQTLLVKLIACALIGCDILLYKENEK